LLELGCGTGTDAATFAQAGHTVVATDFVPAVITAARERYAALPNLSFQEMRIDEPFPFPGGSFDAVYAHLTLHYYLDAQTRDIIREIHRVLAPGGRIMFACKSPADPAWGKGTELEPDMFDFHGKVRHFFSADYARSLLEPGFAAIDIREHRGKLYRQPSGWITAIAQRRDDPVS
jgi:SAM-dependent methyltransferase